MAEGNAANLFGKSAMSRIASADELDHYVKVTNPSAWAVLVAALLLVAGILVWAVVAVVPVTVETTGVSVEERSIYCWVDEGSANKIRNTDATAIVGGVEATSMEVSNLPMSSSEVVHVVGSDFLVDALHLDDWNYLVKIKLGDDPQRTDFTVDSLVGKVHLVPVSITVSETNPIFIVMGKK